MNFKNLDKLIFYLLVGSLSLGQLTRLELPIGGALYAHDLILVGWTLLLLFRWKPTFKFDWRSYSLELVLLSWIGLGWLAALVVGNFQLVTIFYAVRCIFYLSSIYLIARTSKLTSTHLFAGFTIAGLLMLLLGVVQYSVLPDTRFLAILGWDDHYYRLIGTLFDPNFTGMVFILTFIYLEKLKKSTLFQKILPGLTGELLQALLTIGVALTYSRSSYLTFGLLLIALSGLYLARTTFKKAVLPLVFLPILALTIWLAPKPGGEGVNLLRTASVEARVDASQATLERDGRTFLLGEGLFQPQRSAVTNIGFERPNTARFADNLLLFLYNGTGMVGVGLWLVLGAKWGRRIWQHDHLMSLALGSVLIHSLFNNTLLQPFILVLLLGGLLPTFKNEN